MIELLLLLSVLTPLGVVVAWWLCQPPADPGRARPVSIPLNHGQDLLPESDEGEDGLAAFYAYQMAAGKIDRLR
jgi:hypothetical protein